MRNWRTEPMRVCDLIEELKRFPPLMEVRINGSDIVKIERTPRSDGMGTDFSLELRT